MPRVAEALRAPAQDETLVRSRRRQIFLAACRVLARKSFHEASVKELALEAGLAAGSIYLYLDSKDEIIPLIAESMVPISSRCCLRFASARLATRAAS